MVIVPSVTTIGCTRPASVSAALNNPPAVPTASPAKIPTGIEYAAGYGSLSTTPATPAESAKSDPNEMSMPPEKIVQAAANDKMVQTEALENSPHRLSLVKKASVVRPSSRYNMPIAQAKATSLR